jgi:hypothetical protein
MGSTPLDGAGARLKRFYQGFVGLSAREFVDWLRALEHERAVVLMRTGAAPPHEFTPVAASPEANIPDPQLLEACEEAIQNRIPVIRSGTLLLGDAAAADSQVLICPIEPAVGAPAGVLLVAREQPFEPEDLDFYRLVGLSISDVLR